MKCPYCGEEMETGLIQSSHEIAWLPVSERTLVGRAQYYEGSVVLSETSLLHGSAVIASVCRGCEKVVIDCAGGAADFNKAGKKKTWLNG